MTQPEVEAKSVDAELKYEIHRASLNAKEMLKLALELRRHRAFIERLIKEYRGQLTNYIVRCERYVDEYHVPSIALDSVYYYWRNELTAAEAQLSLSDVELMPLIKSEPPFHLAG